MQWWWWKRAECTSSVRSSLFVLRHGLGTSTNIYKQSQMRVEILNSEKNQRKYSLSGSLLKYCDTL